MRTVERSSELGAAPDDLWAAVATFDGVNAELGPWLRMTAPAAWRHRSLADVTPGTTIGRCWLLLFGVVPFDVDHLTIAEVTPRRFLERSTMLTASVWEHERTVEAAGSGAVLHDRLRFELRRGLAWIPGAQAFHAAIVRAIFTHRHRRLRRRYPT